MVAAGIDRREGRTAQLFVKPVQVEIHPHIHRAAHDLLVGRPGRGEARRVYIAVGPLGVEFKLVLRHAGAVVIFGRTV